MSKKIEKRIEDARKAVVEQVIADMGAQSFNWSYGWQRGFGPKNAVTGRLYTGGNRLYLAARATVKGFEDCRWCTYRQAQESGWQVKKGAKSAIVEHWGVVRAIIDTKTGKVVRYLKKAEKNEEVKLGTSQRMKSWYAPDALFNVFNGEDIDGIPPISEDDANAADGFEVADRLEDTSRCRVSEALRDGACYIPSLDRIEVPKRTQFKSPEGFSRTLLHEMTHSTGHETALDRNTRNFFGTPDYAFEELIAELGSMFAAAELGLGACKLGDEGGIYENHLAYLQSWISVLEKDPDKLFQAAHAAEKACSYIIERYSSDKRRKSA